MWDNARLGEVPQLSSDARGDTHTVHHNVRRLVLLLIVEMTFVRPQVRFVDIDPSIRMYNGNSCLGNV